MLTRIEVDGFKNLLGFSAEFGPFTCIAGPNAVGKSNLFDAIEFLSLLAELPVKDAAKRIRGGGEIRDLFFTSGDRRVDQMRFVVDMVTPSTITDSLGETSPPADNLFRYELELGLRPIPGIEDASQIVVTRETLDVNSWTPEQVLRFPGSDIVRDKLLRQRNPPMGLFRSASAPTLRTYISTQRLHGAWPQTNAPINPKWPLPLLVNRELRSWRRLALDPAALRRPDSVDDYDEPLTADGAHLPALLHRLAQQSYDGNPPDPDGFYASLAVRVSDLVPVRDIRVVRDDQYLTLKAELADGLYPARSLSDGTLRLLALAALSFARDQRLLCIEEPENGVHPARIDQMFELLRELATDPATDLEYESTLRQVIINTHSPDFVKAVHKDAADAILVATQAVVPGPFGEGARALRLSPLVDTWRCTPESSGIGPLPLLHYLGNVLPPHE